MSKQAFFTPNLSQLSFLTQKFLPPALVVGGGVAGIQHLLALKREQEKNEAAASKENKDVLVVPIPSSPKLASVIEKLAGKGFGNIGHILESALNQASHTTEAAAATGQSAADAIRAAREVRAANQAARRAERAAAAPAAEAPAAEVDLFAGMGAPPAAAPPGVPPVGSASAAAAASSPTSIIPAGAVPLSTSASSGGLPPPPTKGSWLDMFRRNPKTTATVGAVTGAGAVGGGLYGLGDHNENKDRASLLDASIATGLVGGGLLGGYSLVNSILRRRRKENLERQLASAKEEYSTLLGRTLSKTAEETECLERFPAIHGFLGEFVSVSNGSKEAEFKEADLSSGMLLLGSPGALATISGIVAHKWMYNRQKELERLYTTKKPEPPKQIRLVSTPAPGSSQDDDEPLELGMPEPEKVAGLTEIIDQISATPDERKQEEETLGSAKQPKVVKVGPGTVQIATEGRQPVEIEASDPESAAILKTKAPMLARLIAAYQSTPTSAMPVA